MAAPLDLHKWKWQWSLKEGSEQVTGTKPSPRVRHVCLLYLLSWFVLYMRSFVCYTSDLVTLAVSLQCLIGFM